ncbi:hypothetical protein TeGR_g4959 [Tetraparma gracilis]|uniref:WAT1-related protein n=1 Tax=Tetraparma gracilis TaxID=2962635 RepID=A0ABQ6MV43_9STRA|nr:hypothetical protein TeGR_g4959 [Tetraparma gracilis]
MPSMEKSRSALDVESQTLLNSPPFPSSFSSASRNRVEPSQTQKFVFCFIGLQLSYLTWGFMQEKIMTTEFTPTASSPTGLFPSATFCVFSNRILAVTIGALMVRRKHGVLFPPGSAPIYAFAPCALSNTTSSWAQ